MKPFLPSRGIRHSALVILLCFSATIGFTEPGKKPVDANLFFSAPVAGDDYAHLEINTTITENYIQNDFDPDGDSLSFNGITINTSAPPLLIQTISTEQGGIISFFSNGLYTYTPPVNYAGNDQVNYQICDITSRPLCTTATIHFNIRAGTILPIGISSFSGKKAGKDIFLQWSTAEEINSDHFEVQHSTDNSGFAKLTSIAVQGNTSASYSFVHNNPPAVVNYYRVKLVNKNGSVIYSKVIAIKADGMGVMLQTIYPNPFRDKLEMAITSDKASMINIRLYDMNGKLALTREKKITQGLNIITLTGLNALQPGNYIIDVNGGDNILKARLHKAL